LITWGNVGVDDFDEWLLKHGGFDMVHASEIWHGQAISRVEKRWGSRVSVSGPGRARTVQEAVALTRNAWDKGLGIAMSATPATPGCPIGWMTMPGGCESLKLNGHRPSIRSQNHG